MKKVRIHPIAVQFCRMSTTCGDCGAPAAGCILMLTDELRPTAGSFCEEHMREHARDCIEHMVDVGGGLLARPDVADTWLNERAVGIMEMKHGRLPS